jgi:hypothetical protein
MLLFEDYKIIDCVLKQHSIIAHCFFPVIIIYSTCKIIGPNIKSLIAAWFLSTLYFGVSDCLIFIGKITKIASNLHVMNSRSSYFVYTHTTTRHWITVYCIFKAVRFNIILLLLYVLL